MGDITNEQLQLMLDRFNLGKLISSEKTSKGVGKQTLSVTSSSGEYVLKGNPLFEGQFVEEKFYEDHLQTRTRLPVPFPYLVDESKDIFGWSYSIMPRLPGRHMNDREIQEKLSREDRKRIAERLAECLCDLHSWKTEDYGEFDPANQKIRPFEGSYQRWLYGRIRYWLEDAQKYSAITPKDVKWVEHTLAVSEYAFKNLSSPAFVMGDFKADNILVQHRPDGWRLSGIFDFTTGYFGDGAADLPKMVSMYLDRGEEEVAKQFISVYFKCSETKEGFLERFKVHMLHQKVLDWGCAKAIGDVTWDHDLSFSRWAERYTESAAFLLS
ncbi:phosphotransferase [Paenibacillus sp. DMB20]|nr:phosphotransferase [Paenibacillus sp. DMB20]